MYNLIKSEWYKLSKKSIIVTMMIAILIAEILAVILYFYNLHFSNVEPSPLRFTIYGLAWFTPTFYILFSIFSSFFISMEYENKMWSVLLVSKQSKRTVGTVKLAFLVLLMFITTIVFMILHALINLVINGDIIRIDEFIYIMFAFFIGTTSMQAIQYFFALFFENKVYVITGGILIGILNLLIQSDYLPLKIPEHIINAQHILESDKIIFFQHNFFIYGTYSILVFVLLLVMSDFYIKRKDF